MTNPKMKGAIGYPGNAYSKHPMKIKKPNSSPENEVGHLLNLACLAATGSPLPSDYFTQDWKYVDVVDGSGNKETRHALYKSSSKPALYADPFRCASVNGLEQQIKRHLITDEIKTTFQRTPINPMWFILDILIDDMKRSNFHRRRGTIKELELAMRTDLARWRDSIRNISRFDFDELSPIPKDIRLDIKDAYKKIKEHLPKFRFFEAPHNTGDDRLVLQKEYECLDKIFSGPHNAIPNQAGGVLWTPLFAILNFCELSTTKDAVINAAKNLKVWRSKVKIRSIVDRKKGGPCNICVKESKVVAINTWSFPSCWFGQLDPLPAEKGDITSNVFPNEYHGKRTWNDARDCLTNSGYVKTGKKFWVPHFWMKVRDESETDKNYHYRKDQIGSVLGLEWDRRDKRKVWNYVKDCSSTPNDFVNHNPKGWEDRFANNLISCY